MTDYQEPNRGQFHFSPRRGWMNDPNGLVHYRGTYHFYFQHNPYSLVWDTMHWGHATSTDLVHWQQQANALDPAVHPGELWSGGGVVDVRNTSGLKDGDHDPILVFSGTQGVRVFYSLDGGMTFTAYDEGRVVAQPSGHESRDPKVVWHPPTETWAMVVWSNNDGNGVDFLVSPNLRDWERTGRYVADWFFECPDFTPMELDGELTWVLRDGRGSYVVGDFDGREFTTSWTEPQTITVNPEPAAGPYYAAQSFDNLPDGRIVTMAWQGENRGSTWTGNASFPVEQRLVPTPDGPRIHSWPVDEIRALRRTTRTWGPMQLSPETPLKADEPAAPGAPGASGAPGGPGGAGGAGGAEGPEGPDEAAESFDVEAVFDLTGTSAQSFTIQVRTGVDITYDIAANELNGHPLCPSPDGTLALRLLVDRGQLAIFAADGAYYECLNIEPGNGLCLTSDGAVQVTSLDLHHLKSIW